MKPLISVIVPVYNAENYLHRCMESLLNQTYKNTEILLVNDGSKDNSLVLCKEYEQKYSNVRALDKENGGAASARNKGIDEAMGEYLSFIDADDYVHEYFLEKLYMLCQKYDSDIAMCDFVWTDGDVCDFQASLSVENTKNNTPLEMMYRCCNDDKIRETVIWNKLYKKALFDDMRYPERMTYEDLAMTHKILYKANSVAECKDKMYAYYMSSNSVTRTRYNTLNFDSENRAQDERLVFFENIGKKDLTRKNMIAVQRNRMKNYCKAMLYIKDQKRCDALKTKFNETFEELKHNYGMGFIDGIMFWTFKNFTFVYVHILYRLYDFYSNVIKRK